MHSETLIFKEIRANKLKIVITLIFFVVCNFASIAQTPSTQSDTCTIEARHWYVKTNAIGWAMGIANVSFEFEVAKHLSFTIPMYYSGWDFPTHTTKMRTLAYQPELRYWLRHEGGLFAGAHFGVAWWNIAGGDYRRQDHKGRRPAYGPGVSIGWRTMPRSSRLKFEFSLGAGYYHLNYDRYINSTGGRFVDTKVKNKLLIDNASVSLVYTFRMHDKIR